MEKFNKYSNIQVDYRIWIKAEDGTSILGDDKFQMLKTIKEEGSLKTASEKLRISYRKAWGDLKTCEELLGFPLLEKHRGGADGGRTNLTDEGIRFITLYEEMHNEFQIAVNDIIRKFKKSLKG